MAFQKDLFYVDQNNVITSSKSQIPPSPIRGIICPPYPCLPGHSYTLVKEDE